jgi:hypothetical protein
LAAQKHTFQFIPIFRRHRYQHNIIPGLDLTDKTVSFHCNGPENPVFRIEKAYQRFFKKLGKAFHLTDFIDHDQHVRPVRHHRRHCNPIDILKIDTEGSEVEILLSLHQYLPYVGIVMAEYHSETDRRTIDTMLPNHMLFDAKPCDINLGLVKYINSRLVESRSSNKTGSR